MGYPKQLAGFTRRKGSRLSFGLLGLYEASQALRRILLQQAVLDGGVQDSPKRGQGKPDGILRQIPVPQFTDEPLGVVSLDGVQPAFPKAGQDVKPQVLAVRSGRAGLAFVLDVLEPPLGVLLQCRQER
ncbi:MAG TPA: hypothetical protein VN841_01615 [Bryobacteraceae bacterium]|nr:hypothetical protein [Bryobacteraceae bacterium]